MNGAREFYEVFNESVQVGRLYLIPGSHARGRTFEIYVLPEGYVAKKNSYRSDLEGSVQVYGITGGQPGWTETYGWLHHGKWEGDFNKALEDKKLIIQERNRIRQEKILSAEKDVKATEYSLLSNY